MLSDPLIWRVPILNLPLFYPLSQGAVESTNRNGMDNNAVTRLPITGTVCFSKEVSCYTVLVIQQDIVTLEINRVLYQEISHSIFFLDPQCRWHLVAGSNEWKTGYILSISRGALNNPLLKHLHINQVRLFNNKEVAKINLAPGIEKRTYAIL